MVDYQEIYASQAPNYDRLVSREDYQGNIPQALMDIRPLDHLTAIDLGAGTGRMTELLMPRAGQIYALDRSEHMLGRAHERLGFTGQHNWSLVQADNRYLPFAAECADLAVAGWTFGHFVSWYAESWKSEIDSCLAEMIRVLRPKGTIIILETLGTGRDKPKPPNQMLAEYYAFLQHRHGFHSKWIRTDYHFHSLEEAVQLSQFFFGDELAKRVRKNELTILPECTGIWWRHL